MDPVLTRPAPPSAHRLRDVALPFSTLVLFALLLATVLRLVEPPATVAAVTIENRSPFGIEVVATGAGGGATLPLAAVDPGATTRVDEVLDQGSTWTFRVSRAGVPLGSIERSRARLEADGWRLVVPASWAERAPAPRDEGPASSGTRND